MSTKLENDIILKIENVNKNYGELKVLKNNSLDVKKGEVVCIIGPSGAGKSTHNSDLSILFIYRIFFLKKFK